MSAPLILINSNLDAPNTYGQRAVSVSSNYTRAVAESGGLPLVVPPLLNSNQLASLVAICDGFVFIGGADIPPDWYGAEPHPETRQLNPERAAADRILVQKVLERDVPILGICGGHQLLNVALGGKLIQHIDRAEEHKGDKVHKVTISGGRTLKSLFGERRITVNTSHHQAVDPEFTAPGLVPVAYADDGIIEAFEGEDSDRFLLGVQWHPERHPEKEHTRIVFDAFIRACESYRHKLLS